jgi:lipopolysaccharide/colanic/teichoic acid biosynthesis glycosyltransferase
MIRAMDIGVALLLLLALAPLIGLIALAIRLADGGPAIFRQERVGRNLTPFTIYKLRTMRPTKGAGSAVAHRTGRGDPRITAVGRVLRPLHLDELPQLTNVLAGQMSLVGVRPDTPMQAGDYPPGYWEERHRFAPGITGPAQVAGSELTLNQRTALERQWLAGRSLALYLRLLGQTIGKVFARSSH